jgi:hypothetical protein
LIVNAGGTDWTQAVLIGRGASLPAAGFLGRIYKTTSNPRGTWFDDGSAWWPISPLLAVKSGDTTVSGSVSLVSDADLQAPIKAGAMIIAEADLIVNADNDTMDMKTAWSIPSAASIYYGGASGTGTSAWGVVATGSNPPGVSTTSTQSIGTRTGGGLQGVSLRALIQNTGGGNADGTIKVQYAQATSDPGNLKVLTGSMLRVWSF